MDKTLYYGDVITLYEENQKGYLYARGFINKSLLFNTSSTPKTEGQFVILPKIINMEAMDDERFKGNPNPVLFGSQFCLKHFDSGYFIAGSGETLQSLEGFRIYMSERFTKDCVFKLLPLRTFQHEGDLVYMSSLCMIKNVKIKCMINLEKEEVTKNRYINPNPITPSNSHIFTETEALQQCKLSFDKLAARWRFSLRTPDQLKQRKYLQPNDYIYLVHSQDNSIVSVDSSGNITYKLRDYNNSEIYKALWEVQYYYDRKIREDEMRFRHILTGMYFNHVLSKAPTKITLKPKINTENRLPPFDIYIKDDKFNKANAPENEQLHAYQINKANKTYIKEMLSIKGIHPSVWIPYLIQFLKTNTTVKQGLLREFGIIDTVILIIKRGPVSSEICYNLLYDICKGNIKNKKRICENIDLILNEPDKSRSQELLTQLLSENYDQADDVIEREIKPERIESFLKEFIRLESMYDIQYMRILRAFTGTYKKANLRNQAIIFQYFFYIQEMEHSFLKEDFSKSVVIFRPSVEIPLNLKCRLVRHESGKIYFLHFQLRDQKISPITELPESKREYFRQYFYLLGDCMKNRMQKNILDFSKEFTLDILCDALKDPSFKSFKGPVLNLIKCAYVDFKPQYRCELYFLNGWSELSFKGKLISILPADSQLFFVLDFLKQQIPIERDYFESYNLTLMETLKLTIEFGFWKDMDQLLDIRRTLEKLIFFQTDKISKMRESQCETRRKSNNIVLSKIMAVEIYRLLLNLQLNLWVSDLLTVGNNQQIVLQKINRWLESQNSQWKLDSQFFALASEKNSELMKNSLKLFYRLFNIKKELYQLLDEAKGDQMIQQQEKSPERLAREKREKQFATMSTKSRLTQIATFNNLLSFMVEQCDDFIDEDQMVSFNERFESLFSKKHPNKYFQNLAVKFGLHQRIIDELIKINPANIKSRQIKLICADFYMLIAMMKDNMANKKIVSRQRKDLTKFLRTKEISGLCIEFIEQLYHNNKHLITDHKQVESLSDNILRSMLDARIENRLYECCKHLTVLHDLITLQNKQLEGNQSIIIFQIFKKDYMPILEPPILTMDNNEAAALYNVIMYSLMCSLAQEIFKTRFLYRYNFDVLHGMLLKYKSNWQLKSRIRLYINETYLKRQDPLKEQDKSPVVSPIKERQSERDFEQGIFMNQWEQSDVQVVLMRNCIDDLNFALNTLSQQKSEKWEMFEFERNLRQIISTFKRLLLKFNNTVGKEEKRRSIIKELIFVMFEKLYIMKDYCSVDVLVEIEGLKTFINNLIESPLPNFSQEMFFMMLSNLANQELESSIVGESSENPIIRTSIRSNTRELQSVRQRPSDLRRRSIAQNQLAKYLRNAIRVGGKIYSHENITKINEDILQKFIVNVIQINAKDDSVLSDDIKLFILNFLSQSMLRQQRSTNRKQELEVWYYDLTEEDVEMFQKGQQTYLKFKYDIPELICSLLEESFHQRYRLFNGILELGICLVIGGNTEFQSRFIKAFKKDRKNTIFVNMASLISETLKNIEFFYKSPPSKAEKNNRLIYPTVVRYELNMEATEIEANREERRNSCALVWKVFRFLQLLSQNNNKEMKEYIQNQYDEEGRVKYTSINFIEEANKTLWEVMDILKENLKEIRSFHDNMTTEEPDQLFYRSFKTEIEENLCIIPILIVEFLIEVCQIPSQKNQVYLCRTNFFETVRRLQECIAELDDGQLRFGQNRFSDTIKIRQNGMEVPFFFAIEKKIIVLIRSLLEPNDPFIKQILQKNFTNQAFRFLLIEAFHYGGIIDIDKLMKVLSKYQINSELLNIISLLVIKKSIGKDLSFLNDDRDLERDEYCTITGNMLDLLENRIRSIEVDLYGKTLTVYFPYNPLFDFLSNRTKEEIIYRRFESRNEKLRDMLNSRIIIYEEIEYEYRVHTKFINEKSLEKMFLVSLYLSYFILAMLILFYSVNGISLKLDILQQSVILYAVSVQFIMALMYLILWGMHQAPIALSHLKKKDKVNKVKLSRTMNFLSKLTYMSRLLKMIYLQNYKSRSVLAFFIISFMSAFLSVRFYAFNLFFLFAQIDVFKNIFGAIMTNAKHLLVVCMFGLTFAFVFAFVTLNSYLIPLYDNQQVDIDISKSNKEHCNTIFSCVISLYTQHVIGEGSPGSQTTDYIRFLYDLLFISFFGIFFNNIISGIMIDKFAELRDTREKIQNEIRNKCYICSADKSTLEKRSESFQTHLNEVHNIWNYYFYMYTLERIKSSNDFTGIEYWIQDKINKDDIEWFPYERKYKENILQDKIDGLQIKIDRVLKEKDEAALKREQ